MKRLAIVIGLGFASMGCEEPQPQAPVPPAVQPPASALLSAASVDYSTPWVPASKLVEGGIPELTVIMRPFAASSAPAPPTPERVHDAEKVIASFSRAFRHCYNIVLREQPDAAGSARITADIGPSGEVSVTNVQTDDGLPPEVAFCAADVLKRGKFSPPDYGRATLVIPISFEPSNRATAPAIR